MTIADSNTFVVAFVVLLSVLVVCVLLLVFRLFVSGCRRDNKYVGLELVGSHDLPYEFLNDEESLLLLGDEYDFNHLLPEEQSAYRLGEEFTQNNPPFFHNTRGKSYTVEDDLIVKDRGIMAFEFEQDEALIPRYIVADKTEINFHNNDLPYSTVTSILNRSLPVKNRSYSDTIYFETKIFEFDHTIANGHFAIGLVTKPYPKFRLPGYNNFSLAYESTGNLKINKPFPTPLQQHLGESSLYNALVLPPLTQSDVVGFGYHVLSGTIFITRNGRKLMDVMKGIHVDLYPAVGCFSSNAKFSVNLGQLGFVWIEANVRKYGFVSTSDYKKLAGDRGLTALPQYGTQGQIGGDKLLDKGDELPPRYPEDELDFFGRSAKDVFNIGSSSHAQQKLNEKDGELEEEAKEFNSSSNITHEPEEIMDLRERLYERNITAVDGEDDDSVALLSVSNAPYGATTDIETKEASSSISISTQSEHLPTAGGVSSSSFATPRVQEGALNNNGSSSRMIQSESTPEVEGTPEVEEEGTPEVEGSPEGNPSEVGTKAKAPKKKNKKKKKKGKKK